jgi:hypothetical protein
MSGDGGHVSADGGNGNLADGLGPFNPAPLKQISVNGAPIVEQSHEYVLPKKLKPNAPNQ